MIIILFVGNLLNFQILVGDSSDFQIFVGNLLDFQILVGNLLDFQTAAISFARSIWKPGDFTLIYLTTE